MGGIPFSIFLEYELVGGDFSTAQKRELRFVGGVWRR